ncbi:MAG: hypothetical protein KBD03_04890 [Gammaproteobacteria bacterium]|nr:hypothetical protein [Gammaproteobacteria bacterium]
MIKSGVTKVEDILDKDKALFGKPKRVSIALYDQILNKPNADALAERILLLFTDERGAYKRTYLKRFEVFDAEVLNYLQHYFEPEQTLLLQDVGVSDGRTAVDFFTKVSMYFKNLHYEASDYGSKVYVLAQGRLQVVLNQVGTVLEIVWPPFVFNTIAPDKYRYYPLNRLICFFVQKLYVKPLLKLYQSGTIKPKELLLFAPAAFNLAKNDKRFSLSQYNLLSPFKSQSHVIRIMNVLNTSYFSEKEFSTVFKNIYHGLFESGLLITGSNQDTGSLVHGGVYQKVGAGFKKIWQSGQGSPVEHYILQARDGSL